VTQAKKRYFMSHGTEKMKNSSTKAKVLEMSFIKKANAGMGRSDIRETGKRFNYDFIGKKSSDKRARRRFYVEKSRELWAHSCVTSHKRAHFFSAVPSNITNVGREFRKANLCSVSCVKILYVFFLINPREEK
jgi:hypothetical protein